MHNRKSDKYNDFITDYLDDNRLIIDCALKHGISKENIILDPGVGFAEITGTKPDCNKYA